MCLSCLQLTKDQPALHSKSNMAITIAIFPPACTSRTSAHNESLLTSDQAYSAVGHLKPFWCIHLLAVRGTSADRETNRELLSGLWFVSNTMVFQILALPSTRRALNIASLLSEGVAKNGFVERYVNTLSRTIFLSLYLNSTAKRSKKGIRYNNNNKREETILSLF